jgi:hypothetical protein
MFLFVLREKELGYMASAQDEVMGSNVDDSRSSSPVGACQLEYTRCRIITSPVHDGLESIFACVRPNIFTTEINALLVVGGVYWIQSLNYGCDL